MSTMPTDQVLAPIVRELERLGRVLDTHSRTLGRDVMEIKSSCAVLVERTDRFEQDIRDLRADTERALEGMRSEKQRENQVLRVEIEELKARRWPRTSVAVLVTAVGVVVAAVTGVAVLFVP